MRCTNPSLCYKLHTPSVGLEPATRLSKARIHPHRYLWTVSAGQASLPDQFILIFTGPFQKSCLSVKSCSLVPLGPYANIILQSYFFNQHFCFIQVHHKINTCLLMHSTTAFFSKKKNSLWLLVCKNLCGSTDSVFISIYEVIKNTVSLQYFLVCRPNHVNFTS